MSSALARDILDLTLEHLFLVGVSMAIAAALAIPAGILLTRRAVPSTMGAGICEYHANRAESGALRVSHSSSLSWAGSASTRRSSHWCCMLSCRFCGIL